MESGGNICVRLDMVFPTAGVGFAVHVRPGHTPGQLALHIALRATDEGAAATFRGESSYVLADFAGGFCRWLGTRGIPASYTDEAIDGQFQTSYTPLRVLATLQDLCQLLEDKFGAYPHTILHP